MIALCTGPGGGAFAQTQFLMADRTSDAIFRVRDLNNDNLIADPGEVFLWFNAANAAGTMSPMNPTCQAVSVCRMAVMGDQGNGSIFRMVDINNDGDAQDAGESIIFANGFNAADVSFAFPTGAAFDSQCRVYIVNAGNANGNDGIYRLVDLNGDGDAQDQVGTKFEVTPYVTDGPSGFGPGNGPYSPQEIFFDANDVGYLRNSSAGLHNIYRFVDANNNGRADDAGEFTIFFGTGNMSGITMSAGTGLDRDRAFGGPGAAMYTLQVAPGAVDQLIRVCDLNNDLDGQDAGEAVIVYSNADLSFTSIDVVSLSGGGAGGNGDVLLTDNSGITVVRLHDDDNNGDFLGAGEATLYYDGPGAIAQARQMDILCRLGDVNCNGVVNVDDLLGVINGWGAASSCNRPNVNCDGTVNIDDLLTVISNWGG